MVKNRMENCQKALREIYGVIVSGEQDSFEKILRISSITNKAIYTDPITGLNIMESTPEEMRNALQQLRLEKTRGKSV